MEGGRERRGEGEGEREGNLNLIQYEKKEIHSNFLFEHSKLKF
jgi:hypothetical protein